MGSFLCNTKGRGLCPTSASLTWTEWGATRPGPPGQPHYGPGPGSREQLADSGASMHCWHAGNIQMFLHDTLHTSEAFCNKKLCFGKMFLLEELDSCDALKCDPILLSSFPIVNPDKFNHLRQSFWTKVATTKFIRSYFRVNDGLVAIGMIFRPNWVLGATVGMFSSDIFRWGTKIFSNP